MIPKICLLSGNESLGLPCWAGTGFWGEGTGCRFTIQEEKWKFPEKCPLRPSLSIRKTRLFFEKRKSWWRGQGEEPAGMILKIFNNLHGMKLTTRVDPGCYPSISRTDFFNPDLDHPHQHFHQGF